MCIYCNYQELPFTLEGPHKDISHLQDSLSRDLVESSLFRRRILLNMFNKWQNKQFDLVISSNPQVGVCLSGSQRNTNHQGGLWWKSTIIQALAHDKISQKWSCTIPMRQCILLGPVMQQSDVKLQALLSPTASSRVTLINSLLAPPQWVTKP